MEKIELKQNELFQIRFHAIGGQGAYTVGQMVSTSAFFNEGMKSSVFASYGSEKKGAPVNVFIRMLKSEKSITNFSMVKAPNLVVVFHGSLLKTQDVLSGITDDGLLIINTPLTPSMVANEYNLNAKKILTVDATTLALESGAKLNTVMYGAIIKVLSFLDYEKSKEQIILKLKYKYPDLVDLNTDAFEKGYQKVIKEEITSNFKKESFKKDIIGYKTQLEGGVILGANSMKVDRSISREGSLPKYNQKTCINCTKCDNVCPDDCFVWKEQEDRRGRIKMFLQGIDYKYCKGCLRCVEVCPTSSLTKEIESRNFAAKNTVIKNNNFIEE